MGPESFIRSVVEKEDKCSQVREIIADCQHQGRGLLGFWERDRADGACGRQLSSIITNTRDNQLTKREVHDQLAFESMTRRSIIMGAGISHDSQSKEKGVEDPIMVFSNDLKTSH